MVSGTAEVGRPAAAEAVVRVELIRGSVRCFTLGFLALLPWLGLPFAVAAWWMAGDVLKAGSGAWNPARRYALAARVMAGVGFALSLLSLFGVALGLVLGSA